MDRFIIKKSDELNGRVKVSGAKNSALPIMAASLLTEQKNTILDVPPLRDVEVMLEILRSLGAEIHVQNEAMEISAEGIDSFATPYDVASITRASFLVAGPVLARFGKARIPLPGGCPIGARPVDLHLKGFAALGADISNEHGYVELRAKSLTGAKIYLDFPSVGATENIMMAACLAEGQTAIENAASEPEIVDLANFLNEMGADVKGAGTDTIKIIGKNSLNGTTHTVIPDRIEAGTFMVAVAAAGGDVCIDNVVIGHLKPMIAKLEETFVEVSETETGLRVVSKSGLRALDIKTLPYPGFPTDMQAQFMAAMAIAEGTSIINETVFENRFMHVGELNRMGAKIKIESRSAVVEGVRKLMGAQVKATDLRAGAALIISALTADGVTEISDVYHIDRGYHRIEEKLYALGAKIERRVSED